MEIIIQPTAEQASVRAAGIIARLIRENPRAIIGLATGGTPLLLYKELIRMYREDSLDFSEVTTFNLDEYVGLAKDHPQSYHYFMWENLFQHINVHPERVFIPDGMVEDIPRHCEEYEQQIDAVGGIDLQILGIGTDGHIGFNEPSSSFASRTRIKTLTKKTVEDNARFFDWNQEEVPRHCITMGIGTIMDAERTLLLAFGKGKAEAIAKTVEGPVSAMVPATILQHHPWAKILIDEPAAENLELSDYYQWVYKGKPGWQHNA